MYYRPLIEVHKDETPCSVNSRINPKPCPLVGTGIHETIERHLLRCHASASDLAFWRTTVQTDDAQLLMENMHEMIHGRRSPNEIDFLGPLDEREPDTSASHGEAHVVIVNYADGEETWHGPFFTEEAATRWLDARLELDYKDSVDGHVAVLNLVDSADMAAPEAINTQAFTILKMAEAGQGKPAGTEPTAIFNRPDIETMIGWKQMRVYNYNSQVDGGNPALYENQPHQHDLYSCDVWALHLDIPAEAKDAVLEVLRKLPEEHGITGEYTYGDSFQEWGEGEGTHLVVYFKHDNTVYADQPWSVWWAGERIANIAYAIVFARTEDDTLLMKRAKLPTGATVTTHFAVSTSGDYAEQVAGMDGPPGPDPGGGIDLTADEFGSFLDAAKGHVLPPEKNQEI